MAMDYFGFDVNVDNKVPDSKVHVDNMGPPGSCRPQVGPMLAPWFVLSGAVSQGPLFHSKRREISRYLVVHVEKMVPDQWHI